MDLGYVIHWSGGMRGTTQKWTWGMSSTVKDPKPLSWSGDAKVDLVYVIHWSGRMRGATQKWTWGMSSTVKNPKPLSWSGDAKVDLGYVIHIPPDHRSPIHHPWS